MICAIIDIGSNTMRMSVYKTEGEQFSVLLSKKEMAGLVNYIKEGRMSEEGIDVLLSVLRRFCAALEYVSVDTIHAFATASMRNILNAEEVIARIYSAIGLEIELISGAEEAMLSFFGAVNAAPFTDGCLFDLGGGSTEIVAFDDCHPYYINSMDMGCLNLFQGHVKKIWPRKKEIEEMRGFIAEKLEQIRLPHPPKPLLIGVGGTARSLRELIDLREKRDTSCKEISREELEDTITFLLQKDREVRDAVLKKCPDRIHTIIPGILVVQALAEKMETERFYISDYGVREGYLWKKIIKATI